MSTNDVRGFRTQRCALGDCPVNRSHLFRLSACSLVLAWSAMAAADDSASKNATGSTNPDLSGYVTPEKAITTKVRTVAPDQAGLTGYLGVNLAYQNGHFTIADVQPNSPADKAGLKTG